jgi:hypothetical protein
MAYRTLKYGSVLLMLIVIGIEQLPYQPVKSDYSMCPIAQFHHRLFFAPF